MGRIALPLAARVFYFLVFLAIVFDEVGNRLFLGGAVAVLPGLLVALDVGAPVEAAQLARMDLALDRDGRTLVGVAGLALLASLGLGAWIAWPSRARGVTARSSCSSRRLTVPAPTTLTLAVSTAMPRSAVATPSLTVKRATAQDSGVVASARLSGLSTPNTWISRSPPR